MKNLQIRVSLQAECLLASAGNQLRIFSLDTSRKNLSDVTTFKNTIATIPNKTTKTTPKNISDDKPITGEDAFPILP